MYIKILLTIITACEVISILRSILFMRKFYKYVNTILKPMADRLGFGEIVNDFLGVKNENIKPFQN